MHFSVVPGTILIFCRSFPSLLELAMLYFPKQRSNLFTVGGPQCPVYGDIRLRILCGLSTILWSLSSAQHTQNSLTRTGTTILYQVPGIALPMPTHVTSLNPFLTTVLHFMRGTYNVYPGRGLRKSARLPRYPKQSK